MDPESPPPPPESGAGVIELSIVKEFIKTVDWTEPWLLSLIGFHLLTTVMILLLRRHPYMQAVILSVLAILCFSSERINEYAAMNYDQFTSHQYFDSSGFFIFVIFAGPIIFNCFLIVMCWLWLVWDTMAVLAVKKMRRQQGGRLKEGGGASQRQVDGRDSRKKESKKKQ